MKPGDFVKFEDGSVCCVLFVAGAETCKEVVIAYNNGNSRYTTCFYRVSGSLVMANVGDITEIRRPTQLCDVCYTIFDDGKGDLIYTREEEMTLDRKIKIVEK